MIPWTLFILLTAIYWLPQFVNFYLNLILVLNWTAILCLDTCNLMLQRNFDIAHIDRSRVTYTRIQINPRIGPCISITPIFVPGPAVPLCRHFNSFLPQMCITCIYKYTETCKNWVLYLSYAINCVRANLSLICATYKCSCTTKLRSVAYGRDCQISSENYLSSAFLAVSACVSMLDTAICFGSRSYFFR